MNSNITLEEIWALFRETHCKIQEDVQPVEIRGDLDWRGMDMPAISLFYGVVIYLYFFDDERRKLPHIHAKYQGRNASFSIVDGTMLAGEIPISKAKLVQAWIEIHREALMADWELAVNGQPPFPIDPLR